MKTGVGVKHNSTLFFDIAGHINQTLSQVAVALKEEYNPEIMSVVFKDASFVNDVVKTNAIQILKQHGIDDVKSV